MKNFLRHPRTVAVTWLLLGSVMATGLLWFRLRWIQGDTPILFDLNDSNFFIVKKGSMLFLPWNLFLAWIPLISIFVAQWLFEKTWLRWTVILPLILWLLFLPNAPYIITDFVHYRQRAQIPFWYDIMTIGSFAAIGFICGLFSLLEAERLFLKIFPRLLARVFIILTIPLSAFGIWIGRFLRWNSWDAFTRPEILFQDLFAQVSDISGNADSLGIIPVLSVILLVSYLLFKNITSGGLSLMPKAH